MKNLVTSLVVVAFLVLVVPANAVTVTMVSDNFDSIAVGTATPDGGGQNASLPGWYEGGYSVYAPDTMAGSVTSAASVSAGNSLEMRSYAYGGSAPYVNPTLFRDISGSGASAATPMASATVSFDYNFDYFGNIDGYPTKGWDESTSVDVFSNGGTRIAQIFTGGGYSSYSGGIGTSYGLSVSNYDRDFHNFKFVFDFVADTVSYYIDNAATPTFVDTPGMDLDGSIDFLGTVGISQKLYSPPEGGMGTYMDNLIVTADIVPEPATMSLLAIGGLALLRRKRA